MKVKYEMLLGPYNISGNWSGVMGDVVSGKYPMSLNAWNWILERNYFLDFVPVIKDNEVIAISEITKRFN